MCIWFADVCPVPHDGGVQRREELLAGGGVLAREVDGGPPPVQAVSVGGRLHLLSLRDRQANVPGEEVRGTGTAGHICQGN